MLKRLGMWNRLALVVGIVFTFGLPTWSVYREDQGARKLMTIGHEACMKNQHYVPTKGISQFDYCWDFWHVKFRPIGPSWDDWWIMVFGSAIGALIIYGLVWIVVATTKWIWRGREAGKEPSPVRATPLGNETD